MLRAERSMGHEDDLVAENARLRQLLEAAGIDLKRALAQGADAESRHVGEMAASRVEVATSRSETAVAVADVASGRAREDRFQAILDSALDYAIITTDPNGRITAWNVGAQGTFGWPEEEALGQPLAMIFSPEDQASGVPAAEMAGALRGGRAPDERWHERRDGTRFWAQGAVTPLPGGQGFLKILRDRTATRRTEERLRESEEFNRRILQASADCIKVLDLDARLDFMSEGGMCVMEVEDFGAIKGACWPDFWTDDEHGKALAAVEEAKRGGVGRFQGFATTMKGSPRWWDVVVTSIDGTDGKPEKLLSVSRDVTATRTSETALRASEARLRFMSELDEALRASLDAEGAMFAAAELLAQHVGASRCAYADVDTDSDRFIIRNDYTAPGIDSSVGTYSLDLFGPRASAEMRGGHTLVVRDVSGELASGDGREMFRAIGIEAIICCPLVKAGRLVAMMAVHQDRPRAWRDDEISLVEVAVERCWAYVQRVGAEARLTDSEERLRLAIENAEIGFWDVDVVNDVLIWPPRVKAMFGISPDVAVTMQDFYDGLYPDDREATGLAFLAAADPVRRALYDVEYRTVGKEDGVIRWVAAKGRGVFVDGRCVRVIGTAIDVTERKAAESRFRELAESMSQFAWTADASGSVFWYNKRWYDYTGTTLDEMKGWGWRKVHHPDHVDRVVRKISHSFETGAYWEDTFPLRSATGEYRWFLSRALPIRNESGTVVRWFGTNTDVTEQLKAEDSLRELNETLERRVEEEVAERSKAEEALRQSQKMEAVGQLTGGLAHDFNNLLAGISGSIELMDTRLRQGRIGDLNRYMVAAQGAAKRAAALTHRLLAFSRRQTLDPRPTDVNRLVAGMEDLIRRTVGPSIELEAVAAAGLWPALVDAGQLENALLNLCINARDAMPEGGRITIETANKWLDERASRERELAPGQYLSLCVTDTGTGMTPDVIEKAFDPFFTTKPIGQGTGLGLSMVYGFARQTGGQVRVYSEVGQGTTMCLYLPRHYGSEEVAAEPKPASSARAEQGETVLIVDDEPTVRMLVAEVLEDLGYTAIEAGDGPGGLKVLQSEARIDLLITDVGLPGGMNGRQMADAGRVVRPGLKALFITGYAENAAVGNGHLDPGMQVLTKPFAMDTLAARIREMIEAPTP